MKTSVMLLLPWRVPAGFRALAAVATLALAASAAASPERVDPSVQARIRAFETGLAPAVTVKGEPPVRWSLAERMAHYRVPGLSIAVIEGGRISWARGYGVREAGAPDRIDTQTVFSVGSLSKVGAAAITLRLVDGGALNLDRDVNHYLKRWQVPGNAHTAIRPVTLRGVLSHTAGLSVDGFPDFLPSEVLPTILDTLEGRAPAKTEAVRVLYTPGSQWRYSGGGTTVDQLVIEEVTGLTFPQAAQRYLFEPLGMSRSTYENPLPPAHGNIARAHDENGEPTALPRGWETFPEVAASGLWTTPSDYARLVIAFLESYRCAAVSNEPGPRRAGPSCSKPFLNAVAAREAMIEVGPSPFGLGPLLDGHGMTRRFSHSGANDSYRAWMEGHLSTGNGVVVFTNSTSGGELRREVLRAVALGEGWSIGGPIVVPKYSPSSAELDRLAGLYVVRRPSGVRNPPLSVAADTPAYAVGVRDGSLTLSEAGADHGRRLIPEGPAHFISEDGEIRIEFMRGYDGEIERAVLRGGDDSVEAMKTS